jgi:hypothetical protein
MIPSRHSDQRDERQVISYGRTCGVSCKHTYSHHNVDRHLEKEKIIIYTDAQTDCGERKFFR